MLWNMLVRFCLKHEKVVFDFLHSENMFKPFQLLSKISLRFSFSQFLLYESALG